MEALYSNLEDARQQENIPLSETIIEEIHRAKLEALDKIDGIDDIYSSQLLKTDS